MRIHPAPLPQGRRRGPGTVLSYLAAWAAPSPPRRGSGLAMAARPGLGGRGINSWPPRPPAPVRRTASCSRHRIPPAPGRARPLGPGSRRGRRERAARPGGGEMPPLPRPAEGVGGGVRGGVRGGMGAVGVSKTSPSEVFLNLLSLHPSLPRVPVWARRGGSAGRWLRSLRRALALPDRPGRGAGCGVGDLEGPRTLPAACRNSGVSAAAQRPAMPPRLSAVPRSCRQGLAEEG